MMLCKPKREAAVGEVGEFKGPKRSGGFNNKQTKPPSLRGLHNNTSNQRDGTPGRMFYFIRDLHNTVFSFLVLYIYHWGGIMDT